MYIINSAGIAYHQHGVLYIIIAEAIQPAVDDIRLRRYDVFRFAQNDVAPVGRNDAMFATMCRQAHIIRRSRHHWRSQHHLPMANIIEKRPTRKSWSFFCQEATKKIFFENFH